MALRFIVREALSLVVLAVLKHMVLYIKGFDRVLETSGKRQSAHMRLALIQRLEDDASSGDKPVQALGRASLLTAEITNARCRH